MSFLDLTDVQVAAIRQSARPDTEVLSCRSNAWSAVGCTRDVGCSADGQQFWWMEASKLLTTQHLRDQAKAHLCNNLTCQGDGLSW